MSNFNLNQIVENAADEVLRSESFEEIIKTNVKDALEKSIKDSFNYGALSKAVNKKIEEYLVPYIENYDMSKLVPKLDTVLAEIVNNTELKNVNVMLNNFRKLMTIPEEKTIPLSSLFEQYCKYAADNVDTDGFEVIYEDGPSYKDFECRVTVEDVSSDHSYFERLNVDFECDETFDCEEQKCFNIVLSRWREDKDNGYSIEFDRQPTISSLKDLSDFEIFLMALARANVKITDVEDQTEYITPTNEPELKYE